MTIKRKRRHAREETRLTAAQEMELIIGVYSDNPEFPDDEARRAAYAKCFEDLERKFGLTWAKIQFELGGFLPDEGTRVSKALQRLGIQHTR